MCFWTVILKWPNAQETGGQEQQWGGVMLNVCHSNANLTDSGMSLCYSEVKMNPWLWAPVWWRAQEPGKLRASAQRVQNSVIIYLGSGVIRQPLSYVW